MPPKAKLTKEQIIESAVEEVRACGYEALNARSLASRLGCSTTPIFSCFKNMEEVKKEVVRRATEVYSSFIDEGLAKTMPFKGVGQGYIRFAKAEPQLFQLLFMTSHDKAAALPAADPNSPRVADAAEAASGLSREKVKKLYLEMWIFTHGIAVMLATKIADFTEEEISSMLTDAFMGIKNKLKGEE